MTREIRRELNQATRLYKAGKREDAYEIYARHFSQTPEELDRWDRIRYCWCIYYMHVKDSYDEDEIAEYVEMVTDITKQEDMKNSPVCVYTRCVFKALKFYKKAEDWDYVLYWLDKLNPEFLGEEQGKSGDMIYPSNREEYYSIKSKALLELEEYEECIEVSEMALNIFDDFALNGDTWHRFRIAKSLRQLDQPHEALEYLEEVIRVKDNWYVLKEFAENYCMLEDNENALKYAGKAIAATGPVRMKVNVFYLVFKILKDSDHDLAVSHAKMVLAIKLENGSDVPLDIDELNLDESALDIDTLEYELKNHWIDSELQD